MWEKIVTAIIFGSGWDDDGQKEYKEAENYQAKLQGKPIPFPEVEEKPSAEPIQPDGPTIMISQPNFYGSTILEMSTPDDQFSQVFVNGSTMLASNMLRSRIYDELELPGEMLDYKAVYCGDKAEKKNDGGFTAFAVVICKNIIADNRFVLVGIREIANATFTKNLEILCTENTKAEFVANMKLDGDGIPEKVVLLDEDGKNVEVWGLQDSFFMRLEYDEPIEVDSSTTSDGMFWMYDGKHVQQWKHLPYGIEKLESFGLEGDVAVSCFEGIRSVCVNSDSPVLSTGDKLFMTGTNLRAKVQDLMPGIGGKLFCGSDGLYHVYIEAGKEEPKVTKILDVLVEPMLLGNLYEDPESFWAVFVDEVARNVIYVIDVEKDRLGIIKVADIKGSVLDCSMSYTSEDLVIYSTKETLRLSNLHLFECEEVALDGLPKPPAPKIVQDTGIWS
jgi:hypothetical protein